MRIDVLLMHNVRYFRSSCCSDADDETPASVVRVIRRVLRSRTAYEMPINNTASPVPSSTKPTMTIMSFDRGPIPTYTRQAPKKQSAAVDSATTMLRRSR